MNDNIMKNEFDKFSHIDDDGNAFMVDVADKEDTNRIATACGQIKMSRECYDAIMSGEVTKGDVLTTAQVAGISGVKKCHELIPMCHILLLSGVKISFEFIPKDCIIKAVCTVKCMGKTGVEMEALTGASITLLTIYDMCKAIDKRMVISDIHLMTKSGGKSGEFKFEQ